MELYTLTQRPDTGATVHSHTPQAEASHLSDDHLPSVSGHTHYTYG